MNEEFASLPDEFNYPNEYEVRQNKEINIVPVEYRKVKEYEFDQEFNSDVVDDENTGTTTSLKDQYSKILKILKLATTVSLAATTTSAALPKIVPIINIDATEEKSNSKTQEVTIENTLTEELNGDWSISDIKKYLIIDGEEVENNNTINMNDIISYSVENGNDGLYLSTYENGQITNTTLLTQDDSGNYTCHIDKQTGESLDIAVYLEDESLVIKEVGTTSIEGVTYDSITYYYCTKGSSTYYVNKSPEEVEPVTEEICPMCNGVGSVECDACTGIGLIECSECKGTGYLDSDCLTCLGTGNCAKCNGQGFIESNVLNVETNEETITEEECIECAGTGICITCNGSGKEKCTVCNVEGINKNPGYVMCDTCLGQGKVECSECNGSGKIEINEDNETEDSQISSEESSEDTSESATEIDNEIVD